MTAREIYARIRAMGGEVSPQTVDTCKAGDLGKDVQKLAVCFIATPQVIAEASAWGADMILTHEPTFYTNDDTADTDAVTEEKKRMLADAGVTVCRYHDGLHAAATDWILQGFMQKLGRPYEMKDKRHAELQTPLTSKELAELARDNCVLSCVRLVGNAAHAVKTLGLYLGAPYGDDVLADIKAGASDCIVIGEVCEWSIGEYVRDAGQMGRPISMLILGHAGAERDGMRLAVDYIREEFPTLDVRYLESGEIYQTF